MLDFLYSVAIIVIGNLLTDLVRGKLLMTTRKKITTKQQKELLEARWYRHVLLWKVLLFLGIGIGAVLGFTAGKATSLFQPQQANNHRTAPEVAAIPFLNANPSPLLSSMPPWDWKTESTDSWLTNTSEPPSPGNPQADNGQTNSTGSFRPPRRLTR